jgi:DNA polymerase-4
MNSFYASVEAMLNPSLRDKPVAVCGSTEDRHGIVLAKSEQAKKVGIKTGMATWEARRLCPGLIIVPPQYEQYLKYSRLAREIYGRFTDQVEPFGMDECWLDVTGSRSIFGDGERIAGRIRRMVKAELGLTVSIGVSFNKIFAKLGSDMKKPDAVTILGRDDFRERVWPLPAGELLYVGRATERKLAGYGIRTIGGIAQAKPEFLRRLLGKNGLMLWAFANGEDRSRVMHRDFVSPVKSVGHGTTCTADLASSEEVGKVMLYLAQDVGHRLRVHSLAARGVQITVKDGDLFWRQYQAPLPLASQSPGEIAALAFRLFEENYHWEKSVRAVTVRAINLAPENAPEQLDLFCDFEARERRRKADDAVEEIRRRFGEWAVYPAALLGDLKLPATSLKDVVMPGVCTNSRYGEKTAGRIGNPYKVSRVDCRAVSKYNVITK